MECSCCGKMEFRGSILMPPEPAARCGETAFWVTRARKTASYETWRHVRYAGTAVQSDQSPCPGRTTQNVKRSLASPGQPLYLDGEPGVCRPGSYPQNDPGDRDLAACGSGDEPGSRHSTAPRTVRYFGISHFASPMPHVLTSFTSVITPESGLSRLSERPDRTVNPTDRPHAPTVAGKRCRQ